MSDIDISQALKAEGTCCLTNEVLSEIKSLSPILFQLEKQTGPFTLVRVAPQIDICQDFLDGTCHRQLKPCDKLHICRFFGRCERSGCGFPHDLTHGYNHQLIQQMNLQEIDDKLLIDFIRLKKQINVPFRRKNDDGGYRRGRKPGGRISKPPRLMNLPTDSETASIQPCLFESTKAPASVLPSTVSKEDINQQIDVVFPVKAGAEQIDAELVDLLLSSEGIRLESIINETKSRYFVRMSLQLKSWNDVEKARAKPVIIHENCKIKLKLRKKQLDPSCFLLKTPIDRVEDKIINGRINLYAKTLAIDAKNLTLIDISTNTEQINLVQSDSDIDFNKVYEEHKLKPTVQERPMSLARIYQYDTIVVRNIDEKRLIHYDDLQRIFGDCWENVFCFKFTSGATADVEFLTSDHLKQWLGSSENIKAKSQITITPVVNEVIDKQEYLLQSSITTAAPLTPNIDTRAKIDAESYIKIQLRTEWALIASHALFQDELKAYIKTQLGSEVEVRNDEIIYKDPGTSPGNGQKVTSAIIANKTNNFMQRFRCETLRNLNGRHLQVLREHTKTVVWKRQNNRDYLVATKRDAMGPLRMKLFPPKKVPNGSQRGSQRSGSPVDDLNNDAPTLRRSSSDMNLAPVASLPTSMYRFRTAEEISMFDIDGFETRLEQYLEDTYQVTIRIERSMNQKTAIIIHIEGTDEHISQTENQLKKLFSSLKTEILNEKQHGRWIKLDETLRMLRYHFQQEGLLCSCQRAAADSIKINHFDSANHEFGVDEKKINSLIGDLFNGSTVNLPPPQGASAAFLTEWNNIKKEIQRRDDYAKNVYLFDEDKSIYFFGLKNLVKEFHERFEKLKRSFSATTLKIELTEQQIKYLNNVVKQDFAKFIKDLQSQGCDFNQVRFRQQGEIVAPPHLHQKIKDDLNALAQCLTGDFEIRNAAFYSFVTHKFDDIIKIAKPRCYIQKELKTERISIPIPRAKATDNATSMATTAPVIRTVLPSLKKIHVGQSSIEILTGDLARQNVDVIVLSLTSEILCHGIVSAAGPDIVAEYNARRSAGNTIFFVSNGILPCKKILILPMLTNSTDSNGIQVALKEFVKIAIELVAKQKMKSLAFPSVGCGKLGHEPSIVAKAMISQTYSQLATSDVTLDVSFILMPNQQSVYDAFIAYLNSLERSVVNAPTTTLMTTQRPINDDKIFYDSKIVKITLISSSQNHIAKCKANIEEFATSILYEQTFENKRDLLDWTQNTINDFYRYCLVRDVIPKLDLDMLTVHLKGDKDAVHEAEKQFLVLTTETFREARLRAVTRGIIWSVETVTGSDNWEQYSFKNSAEIEDSYNKKQSQASFLNEQGELCVITFDSMHEHYQDRRRRVRRSETNSSLPSNWEESAVNCKRVILPPLSQEYVDAFKLFNATMQGKYQRIVTIERIQNERWYKQYAAHRDEYNKRHQKLDERQLFHGCSNDAAEKIIQECFNRSFAGVNGVLFGHGVYFHTDANYSHNYAKAGSNGDRKMFIARVLIGNTIVGNPNMRVAPPGYDTTTDGQKIFVVYHDAAAYAEYLITYQ